MYAIELGAMTKIFPKCFKRKRAGTKLFISTAFLGFFKNLFIWIGKILKG